MHNNLELKQVVIQRYIRKRGWGGGRGGFASDDTERTRGRARVNVRGRARVNLLQHGAHQRLTCYDTGQGKD